jgi:hypothetical protein
LDERIIILAAKLRLVLAVANELDDAPYEFGPVENKQHRIVGLVMLLNQELPDQVAALIDDVIGEPTINTSGVRLWRLVRTISYIENDWRWLIGAIEWDASERLGCDVTFAEWEADDELADALIAADGPEFDIHGPGPTTLVGRYRASKATASEQKQPREVGNGFQRLLHRSWAIRDENLKPIDRLTLFAILRYCWSKDHCEVTESLLAADVGCSVRSLQRSLSLLVKHKYIGVTRHHNRRSTYTILKKELIPPYPRVKTK